MRRSVEADQALIYVGQAHAQTATHTRLQDPPDPLLRDTDTVYEPAGGTRFGIPAGEHNLARVRLA